MYRSNNYNKRIGDLTNNQANTVIGILDKMEDLESKQAFMRQIHKNDIHKIEFKDVMDLFKNPDEKTFPLKIYKKKLRI